MNQLGFVQPVDGHPAQAQPPHQPLNSTESHGRSFTPELPPYLVGTVDLHVGLPDALNLRRQQFVALVSSPALVRLAHQRGVAPMRRRGNLLDVTERLDPESNALLVDKGLQDFSRRSSSAWAKMRWPVSVSRWPDAVP